MQSTRRGETEGLRAGRSSWPLTPHGSCGPAPGERTSSFPQLRWNVLDGKVMGRESQTGSAVGGPPGRGCTPGGHPRQPAHATCPEPGLRLRSTPVCALSPADQVLGAGLGPLATSQRPLPRIQRPAMGREGVRAARREVRQATPLVSSLGGVYGNDFLPRRREFSHGVFKGRFRVEPPDIAQRCPASARLPPGHSLRTLGGVWPQVPSRQPPTSVPFVPC